MRIVNLVPESSRVLEIGCGSGTVASYLARVKGCRVIAVEPDPRMAAETQALGLPVFQGKIEDPSLQKELFTRSPYDILIFADVLEHLRDPWSVLTGVRPWLSNSGVVLASVPNVAHWSIRLSLLAGRWEYTEGYLMDHTHLHWFTRQAFRQLFIESGYQVTDFQVRWAAFRGDRLWRRLIPGRTRIYAFLAQRWPGIFGYQFVIRAQPVRG